MHTAMKYTHTSKKHLEDAAHCRKRLSEARHDGTWLPKQPTHRNPTDKPTIYYIGVDDSDDFREYGSYVMLNGKLTANASNSAFKLARVTTQKSTLESMVNDAVLKYGKTKYIFVFKEEYSYGVQTRKRHARPSVVDIWYPNGQYWRYGLSILDGYSKVNESSRALSDVNSIKVACRSNADLNGKYFKTDVESEMHYVGIEDIHGQDWMSYVLSHLFSSSSGWTTEIEDVVLDTRVKRLDILIDGDLVSIEKNA